MRLQAIVCAALLFVFLGWAKPGEKARLADLADQALRQSQPSYPGSRPFQLEANIVETTNPRSAYRARIEEFWVSPGKYRRVIEAPEFAQTLVVNGDQVYEKNTGDYYPWWLQGLVTAIFDPLSPMGEALTRSTAEIPKPGVGERRTLAPTCARGPTAGWFASTRVACCSPFS